MNKMTPKNKANMELRTESQNAKKKMWTNRQIIEHNPYQNTVESAKWNKQKKVQENHYTSNKKTTPKMAVESRQK